MALDRILEQTRADLARRMRSQPLATLLGTARGAPRSLEAALRRRRTGFVLECKRASPSEGRIRDDYDPAAIAACYAPHADAVSVLTDGPFFQGSLDHLRAVRAAVDLPVLRKDFVVDPYQVVEARAAGADAILLMLAALDDGAWRACAAAAADCGLEPLTEVHDDAELDRALALDARVIGINNRNLRTLAVDRTTVARLAPRVPADRVVICESGIRDHADVRPLRPLVDGFLVGTSLMRQPDLARAVPALIYGRVKVCGLTRGEDAIAAWRAGATFGGLIFAAESPRRVTGDVAEAVRSAAPLQWVGVFVNEAPDTVARLARALSLSAVQLHGEENGDTVARVRALLPSGCELWKAVRVADTIPSVAETGADRLVLDTYRDGTRGGTGHRFDWSLLSGRADRDRMLLGGGLTPDVAAAAADVGTWGLDVNSGVEAAPGLKSAAKIEALFTALRGAGRGKESA